MVTLSTWQVCPLSSSITSWLLVAVRQSGPLRVRKATWTSTMLWRPWWSHGPATRAAASPYAWIPRRYCRQNLGCNRAKGTVVESTPRTAGFTRTHTHKHKIWQKIQWKERLRWFWDIVRPWSGAQRFSCTRLQDYLNHLHSNVLRCMLPLGCLVRLFGEALGVYILAVPPLESWLHCSRDGLFLFSGTSWYALTV